MVICFLCVVTITFSGVNTDDKEEKEVEDDTVRKVSMGTLIFGYVLIFLASWTQATNQVLVSFFLPFGDVGHENMLQTAVLLLLPEHGLPPPKGLGLLHVRVFVFIPPSQVLEQDEYEP